MFSICGSETINMYNIIIEKICHSPHQWLGLLRLAPVINSVYTLINSFLCQSCIYILVILMITIVPKKVHAKAIVKNTTVMQYAIESQCSAFSSNSFAIS